MADLALVCVPKEHWHVKDSTLDVCATCDAEVWVSISGRKAIEEHAVGAPYRIVCIGCAAEERDVEIIPPTREQIDAVHAEAARQAAVN